VIQGLSERWTELSEAPKNYGRECPRPIDGARSGLSPLAISLRTPLLTHSSRCRIRESTMLRAGQQLLVLSIFEAKLAIVLSDNPVALAGGVFKFLAVHDLHCATGVLDELLSL
jgi:hypothetical protein